MGLRDRWHEWRGGLKLALAVIVACFASLAWMVASTWYYVGALAALIVLMWFGVEATIWTGFFDAPRRVVNVIAAVLLAASILVVASTGDFAGVGALGVLGSLAFFVCDFLIHRDGRIRLEKD